jgi:hypothetical protein
MKRFFHNSEEMADHRAFFQTLYWSRFPVCRMSNENAPSQSSTDTSTTSGASSPSALGSSQAIGSGSIGVAGTDAKYLESGATDNSGQTTSTSNAINTGSGSSVTIGDPNADALISSLANQFSNAVQSTAASAASGVQAAVAGAQSGTISIKTIGIFIAIVAALIGLFTLLKKK